MAQFTFRAQFARRLPDPVFHEARGVDRHILLSRVRDVPRGLPLEPNARVPNTNRRVYREIEQSLLDAPEFGEPGTFHLKHKGITVIADRVAKTGDEYRVHISDGQGILDGGHSYDLILKHLEDEELPEDQYVKFEILTGLPKDWITDLARGLNTSMQVQPISLDDLKRMFDPIKEVLQDEPYFAKIAWREGQSGEFDARDLIGMMTCFNIDLFPNEGDTVPPVIGYEKKSQALKLFEDNRESYEKVLPLLKDILVLHDTIRKDARDRHNEAGGRGGGLAFVERRKRGEYAFPFIGETGEFRLMNGALFPMLAAFRWMVEEDPETGKFRWRGGFSGVLEAWEAAAAELMRMTQQASVELGRNPNAIGKSRNHWANLHARVAMRDLLARAEKATKAPATTR